MPNDFDRIRRYEFVASASGQTLGFGVCTASTTAVIFIPFSCKMASPPTGISVSAVSDFNLRRGSGSVSCTNVSFVLASEYGIRLFVSVSSGLTQGQAVMLETANTNATLTATGGIPNY